MLSSVQGKPNRWVYLVPFGAPAFAHATSPTPAASTSHLCNGPVVPPYRAVVREVHTYTGKGLLRQESLAQGGLARVYVLRVCTHVNKEVHTLNPCYDKHPAAKMPTPPTCRVDHRQAPLGTPAETNSHIHSPATPSAAPRILRTHHLSVQVNSLHCRRRTIVRTPRIRREHFLIRFCRTLTHKQKILISSGTASIAVYTDQRTFWVQRGCACHGLLLYKLGKWARDRPACRGSERNLNPPGSRGEGRWGLELRARPALA